MELISSYSAKDVMLDGLKTNREFMRKTSVSAYAIQIAFLTLAQYLSPRLQGRLYYQPGDNFAGLDAVRLTKKAVYT